MTDHELASPSSWAAEDDEVRRARPRWWALIAAALVVLAVVGSVVIFQRVKNKDVAWPASLGGRPAGLGAADEPAATITATAAPGVYLWNDFQGWHLWIVGADQIGAVRGEIEVSHDLRSATLANPKLGTVTPEKRSVSFALPADATVTGIDFQPGFYTRSMDLTLTGPDGALDPSLIHLGAKATSPTAVPVHLAQVPTDEAPNR